MNSPPHRHNILHRKFREIGIGIARGVPVRANYDGATYATDFGTPRLAAAGEGLEQAAAPERSGAAAVVAGAAGALTSRAAAWPRSSPSERSATTCTRSARSTPSRPRPTT